jgi:cytochrome c-type biogenesis protein CcmH
MIPFSRLFVASLLLACLFAFHSPSARAGEATPLAEDPVLEARVMRLSEELRCLVCQNQTIADSHAGLAIDLKNQIREQLRAGRTDAEVLAYMVERYGDFVLYRPPVKATTAALWYGPFALLAFGGAVVVTVVRRRRPRAEAAGFTADQRQRAAKLLADEPEVRS